MENFKEYSFIIELSYSKIKIMKIHVYSCTYNGHVYPYYSALILFCSCDKELWHLISRDGCCGTRWAGLFLHQLHIHGIHKLLYI